MLPSVCALLAWSASATTHLAFYNGNGTSSHANGPFFTTLNDAARSAFGAHNFTITNITDKAVAAVTRSTFDVIIFPGGSGNEQAEAIGPAGIAALRKFVAAGGGYIGTCGGAFLGLQHALFYGDGPLGRGPPTQEPFDRGHGNVSVEFLPEGLRQLKLDTVRFGGGKNVTILYWQGPIVKPIDLPANVSQLGTFRTEIHTQHTNETTGAMVNTPAFTSIDGYGASVAAGQESGGGRVVLNSPHPELDPNIPEIYAGELQWVVRM